MGVLIIMMVIICECERECERQREESGGRRRVVYSIMIERMSGWE